MIIIEIQPLSNGAHANQTVPGASPATFPVPAGWAVIPEGMETPNFPFGTVTVDSSTPPVVTSWSAGEIPETEPEAATETATELDRLEAQVAYTAMMTDTLLTEG